MAKVFFLFILLSVSLSAQEYTVKDVPNPKTVKATHSVSNPDGILKDSTVEKINALLQYCIGSVGNCRY